MQTLKHLVLSIHNNENSQIRFIWIDSKVDSHYFILDYESTYHFLYKFTIYLTKTHGTLVARRMEHRNIVMSNKFLNCTRTVLRS